MNSLRKLPRTNLFKIVSRYLNQSQPLSKVNNQPNLQISQACVERLNKITTNGQFLRITVDGGGCSGFQYRFDLDSEMKNDDECFEKSGVKIVVDKMSLPFIQGSTVDYHEELIRSAFRIIDNPQAESKCSCGSSFAIKM